MGKETGMEAERNMENVAGGAQPEAPADDYEGLISARGLEIFGKECVAPLVGAVASLADSSAKIAERVNDLERKVPTTVRTPSVTIGDYVYNRAEQGPTVSGPDVGEIAIEGATGVNAREYTLRLSLKSPDKQVWDDGTVEGKAYAWSIAPKEVEPPAMADPSVEYNGAAQSPPLPDVNGDEVEIGGTTSATDVGSYVALYSLTDMGNYVWSDGTTAPKSASWSITPKRLEKPALTNAAKTYSGAAQSPTLPSVDPGEIQIGGDTSATNAGSYTVTYTLKNTSNYVWSDGTTAPKSETWTIAKKSVAKPTLSNTIKTYNGSSQSPTLPSVNAAEIQIGGTTSATNAGSYTVTYTLKNTSNYVWSDGTAAQKSDSWTINRAAGSLSLNKSSLNLGIGVSTGTVTATRSGNGAITATSSKTSVATVSVSGTTVTVTAKGSGTATITVNCAAGTNHNAPASKTVSVTVQMANPTLASNTPATIKAVAQSGQAANVWKVGDKIPIAINGTVGSLNISGTYYAFIIGFNHNSAIEGGNSIHFQFGKTSNGTDIAFVDEYYDDWTETGFRIYALEYDPAKFGWKYSFMRSNICPAFLAALPADWRNAITACTKYSDNSSNIVSTQDKIWLLSEFEVFGKCVYANEAEQNYQKQYDYYKNGNSKIKYKHNNTGETCGWHNRSAYDHRVCYVSDDGSAGKYTSTVSKGFAPGFKIA